MGALNVNKHRQAKLALKFVKHIGQGGPLSVFFDEVQKFTRTMRIVLGVARAWEARVDNRLLEVSMAEAW